MRNLKRNSGNLKRLARVHELIDDGSSFAVRSPRISEPSKGARVMAGGLHERNAIVTGAGSGIGAASAAGLAREGAGVVVADIGFSPCRKTNGTESSPST